MTLTIALLNGVVVRFAMNKLNNTFDSVNDEGKPETAAPKSRLRSGGPESLVTWASLGHQGRIFVQAGPTVAKLTDVQRRPGHRTDPGLRGTELRRRHHGDRRVGRG